MRSNTSCINQRTHGTTFRALKVTSQVTALGAESAVYDCHVNSALSSPGGSHRSSRIRAVSTQGTREAYETSQYTRRSLFTKDNLRQRIMRDPISLPDDERRKQDEREDSLADKRRSVLRTLISHRATFRMHKRPSVNSHSLDVDIQSTFHACKCLISVC